MSDQCGYQDKVKKKVRAANKGAFVVKKISNCISCLCSDHRTPELAVHSVWQRHPGFRCLQGMHRSPTDPGQVSISFIYWLVSSTLRSEDEEEDEDQAEEKWRLVNEGWVLTYWHIPDLHGIRGRGRGGGKGGAIFRRFTAFKVMKQTHTRVTFTCA